MIIGAPHQFVEPLLEFGEGVARGAPGWGRTITSQFPTPA
jgi:hypothetical protein